MSTRTYAKELVRALSQMWWGVEGVDGQSKMWFLTYCQQGIRSAEHTRSAPFIFFMDKERQSAHVHR